MNNTRARIVAALGGALVMLGIEAKFNVVGPKLPDLTVADITTTNLSSGEPEEVSITILTEDAPAFVNLLKTVKTLQEALKQSIVVIPNADQEEILSRHDLRPEASRRLLAQLFATIVSTYDDYDQRHNEPTENLLWEFRATVPAP